MYQQSSIEASMLAAAHASVNNSLGLPPSTIATIASPTAINAAPFGGVAGPGWYGVGSQFTPLAINSLTATDHSMFGLGYGAAPPLAAVAAAGVPLGPGPGYVAGGGSVERSSLPPHLQRSNNSFDVNRLVQAAAFENRSAGSAAASAAAWDTTDHTAVGMPPRVPGSDHAEAAHAHFGGVQEMQYAGGGKGATPGEYSTSASSPNAASSTGGASAGGNHAALHASGAAAIHMQENAAADAWLRPRAVLGATPGAGSVPKPALRKGGALFFLPS